MHQQLDVHLMCASVWTKKKKKKIDQGLKSHATPNGTQEQLGEIFFFFFSFFIRIHLESSIISSSFKNPPITGRELHQTIGPEWRAGAGERLGSTGAIDRLHRVDRLLIPSKRFKYGCSPADWAIHQTASHILQEGLGQKLADWSKTKQKKTKHCDSRNPFQTNNCVSHSQQRISRMMFAFKAYLQQTAHYCPIVSLHEPHPHSELHLAFSPGSSPAVSGQVKQDISGLLARAMALKL